jgi:hypothetical protein
MTPLAPLIPRVIDFTARIVASGQNRGKTSANQVKESSRVLWNSSGSFPKGEFPRRYKRIGQMKADDLRKSAASA